VENTWIREPKSSERQRRVTDRVEFTAPARLTWKDQRGTTRFASVVTRNVSEYGVYVESSTPLAIPLYRLVQFQLERQTQDGQRVPSTLRDGRALSAVYRITPPTPSGSRQGFALRLMVDPKKHVATELPQRRATA
jgi:hypothetical protein